MEDPPQHDRSAPPDRAALDEVVSAVLDGEATTEETAEVLTDPVLSSRLGEFDLVRSVHLSLDPFDDGPLVGDAAGADARRDERVALALAAFDSSAADPRAIDRGGPSNGVPSSGGTDAGATDSDGTDALITPIGARSRRRLGWVGAVAAVLVVVTLGATVVRTAGRSDTDSFAANTEATTQSGAGRDSSSGTGTDRAAVTTTAPGVAAEKTAPAPSPSSLQGDTTAGAAASDSGADAAHTGDEAGAIVLGDFTDLAALRGAAIDATRGRTASAEPPPCATAVVGDAPVLVASARIEGAAVVVLVPSASGAPDPVPADVVVLDPVTCRRVG